MNRQERFSLRKYKFGVASVLLGAVLVFGSAQASAEEQAASQTSAGTQLVATTQQAPAEEEHSQATEASTAVASEKVEVAKKQQLLKRQRIQQKQLMLKNRSSERGSCCSRNKTGSSEKPVEKQQKWLLRQIQKQRIVMRQLKNLKASKVTKLSLFPKPGSKAIKGKGWLSPSSTLAWM